QEYIYSETAFSGIDNNKPDMNNGIALKTLAGRYAVQSPLMMKSADNLYVNIFEAAVINYPVMHLTADTKNFTLTSTLAPNAAGFKAYLQTPFNTPWRTVIVSDDARKI